MIIYGKVNPNKKPNRHVHNVTRPDSPSELSPANPAFSAIKNFPILSETLFFVLQWGQCSKWKWTKTVVLFSFSLLRKRVCHPQYVKRVTCLCLEDFAVIICIFHLFRLNINMSTIAPISFSLVWASSSDTHWNHSSLTRNLRIKMWTNIDELVRFLENSQCGEADRI